MQAGGDMETRSLTAARGGDVRTESLRQPKRYCISRGWEGAAIVTAPEPNTADKPRALLSASQLFPLSAVLWLAQITPGSE